MNEDLRDAGPHVPTSELLLQLIRDTPGDHVTLAWVIAHLRTRSFGVVLLLLGICGLLPLVSPIAGIGLFVPAFQMLRAQPAPALPRYLAAKPIATERFMTALRRIIPVLRFMERFIRPRWRTPFQATKQVVGGVMLLLAITLLAPFPLSNIPVGITIILVAFAYIEEDGILLLIAILTALVIFGAAVVTVWGMVGVVT